MRGRKVMDLNFPPGPSSIFPTNILNKFLKDPLNTLTEIANKYGEISYFKMGVQHVYLINNPDDIERILIYDHGNFKKGPRLQTAKRVLGEGLVTSEGETHRNQRKIIQPVFLPKMIASYDEIMSQFAYNMCTNWRDGSIVDIHDEMMRVTLSIICKSVMSYDIESLEADKISKSLEISKNYMKRLQHPLGQVLDHIPILPKVAQSRSAIKVLDSIVYKIISERKSMVLQSNYSDNNVTKYKEKQNQNSVYKEKDMKSLSQDLLTRLMYNTTLNTKQDQDKTTNNTGLSDIQLRDQIITFLIAGHETTANALTWTFYLLTQNSHVEENLFQEIKTVLKDKKIPSFRDIPKLKYTEKVFRESMRMYPPVWTMGRFVENPYSIGKYTIPKGSTILMSQYVMHHNSKYYDEPHIYNPDRWTEEFKQNLPRFAYFPFGGGIRGCIGESFAWQEGILLLSTVMKYWKMQLVPNQKIKLNPGITLNPKKGIKIKVIQR
ncbi:MAG TPA: cytochrome P450 [Nitrososphaeraceae archaeon]|nr:cytochrome P450 [Nitrososphaeraceae archaeon]